MGYVFYLNGVQLPIPPTKMTTKIKSNNSVINLINEGDINILKLPSLTEFSFDFLLPSSQYPFAKGYSGAKAFLKMLEKLKKTRKPCRFIVSGDKIINGRVLNTNMSVSIEDYSIKENADDLFDITVSIKLKQYKAYRVKTVKISGKNITVKQERSKESAPNNKTHTVKEGETLWNIAKKEYGDGSAYSDIYANNAKSIHNPNVISAGQVLIV